MELYPRTRPRTHARLLGDVGLHAHRSIRHSPPLVHDRARKMYPRRLPHTSPATIATHTARKHTDTYSLYIHTKDTDF
jgi:hypothetical protein